MIGAGVFPRPTSVCFPDSYKQFSVQDLLSRPLQNPTPARHNGSAAQLFTILSYSGLNMLLQNGVHPGRLFLLEPSNPRVLPSLVAFASPIYLLGTLKVKHLRRGLSVTLSPSICGMP